MATRSSRSSAVASGPAVLGDEFFRRLDVDGAGSPAQASLEEGHLLASHGVEPGHERLALVLVAAETSHHAEKDLARDVLGCRRRAQSQQDVAVDGVEVSAVEGFDGRLLAPAGRLDQALLTPAVALVRSGVAEDVDRRPAGAGHAARDGRSTHRSHRLHQHGIVAQRGPGAVRGGALER